MADNLEILRPYEELLLNLFLEDNLPSPQEFVEMLYDEGLSNEQIRLLIDGLRVFFDEVERFLVANDFSS